MLSSLRVAHRREAAQGVFLFCFFSGSGL